MATVVRQVGRHVGPPLRRTLASAAVTATTEEQHTATATATATPRPVTEIPGPKIYPVIGSLPELLSNKYYSISTIDKLWASLIDRYGPIVRLINPGMEPVVLVKDADEAETLNRATYNMPQRPPLASLKKLRDEITDYFEKKGGILVEQNEEWWRVRSKVQVPMMKLQSVEVYLPDMDAVSKDFLDRIALLQAKHGEMPSNFQEEFYKWGLETVGVVVFNRRLGCLSPQPDSVSLHLIELVNTMFSSLAVTEMGVHLWKIFPTPTYRKLRKCHHEFLRITDSYICDTVKRLEEETEARNGSEDGAEVESRQLRLMETLLLNPGLTYKDVVTFVLDLVFGGIDTTSHTVAFAMYLLAKNPQAQKTLREEVDSVLAGHDGPLTKTHLARMSYLKAVIKETLRIYPLVLGLGRILTKDVVIKGYNVTAGHIVLSLNMLLGWEDKYFPRANEFLPERWLRHRPLGPIHPFASLPFGGGTRMCIGRRVAEQEMYTLLVRAVQRYNIDYKYEDIGIETGMVFKPNKPLRFTFTERH